MPIDTVNRDRAAAHQGPARADRRASASWRPTKRWPGALGVEGVVIVSTAPGSGAARAGLTGVDVNRGTLGDVIVAANGRKVRRLSDLVEVIDAAGIGKSVQLTVERDGRAREVPVEVSDVGRAS